ncbi:hypothetical protein [Bacillus rubiinfantis]|uniref:hypothetical protein n=1 Tax=Bacillus rubiinfantis TaxID=1499680 RepID=UPI0005A882D9|nr:hypothetical protein [Bacillus rubiinfantis]
MSVNIQYKADPIFSYRHVREIDINQMLMKDLLVALQKSKNEYIANAIFLQKTEPMQHDLLQYQGKEYLLLEMANEIGSFEALGIRRPIRNTINISIMTYLFGEKVKEAIVEVLYNMKMNPNICLFIIGTGPLRSTIQSIARTYGVADRLHLVSQLLDPFRLINFCDLFIPVPNGRLHSLKWRRHGASISGYLYIPGFHQENEESAIKKLRFKDQDNQLIYEIEMKNQYNDWLSQHPNHGNSTLNYQYAGFETILPCQQFNLEGGTYNLFLSISQDKFHLEIPFINSIRRRIPNKRKFKGTYYSFLEYQEQNRQLGVRVFHR